MYVTCPAHGSELLEPMALDDMAALLPPLMADVADAALLEVPVEEDATTEEAPLVDEPGALEEPAREDEPPELLEDAPQATVRPWAS